MIFSNCFRLICTRFPLTITQPASRFSSASLRNFFSPIRKYFDASSIVSVYFSQIGISVLFVMYKHPLYCVSFGSRQTALEKLRWYLNQSHSYEQNHLWDVSLSCEYRSWQSDFSNGRSRITAWVARSLLERSWRTVPVARCITNVSVCFIHLSKNNNGCLYACQSPYKHKDI